MKKILKALFILSVLGEFLTPSLFANELKFDVEVDPLAYALNGFSIHGGISGKFGRVDLGVFGLELSEELLGQDGFESRFKGVGMKWDLQPSSYSGFIYGLEASRNQVVYQNVRTRNKIERFETVAGLRLGYRIFMGSFYALPWLGIDHNFDADEVSIDGDSMQPDKVIFFPTVHIGYMFD